MKQLDLNNFKDFGEAEVGRRILVDDPVIRVVLVFRFGLSYPDERHLERFAELCDNVPGTLQELRSRYIDLFEAGMPQSRCPLLESAWLLNRPAGDVVLAIISQAEPDHLLTQLEFLAWLDHCLAAGNPDAASLERARAEFLERHMAHWI